jgi:hypothetical protein
MLANVDIYTRTVLLPFRTNFTRTAPMVRNLHPQNLKDKCKFATADKSLIVHCKKVSHFHRIYCHMNCGASVLPVSRDRASILLLTVGNQELPRSSVLSPTKLFENRFTGLKL